MITFFSLDPGTNFTGLSVWFLDNKFRLLDIETVTVTPLSSELKCKIEEITESVFRLVEDYQPVHFVYENPFFNRFRPTAFEPIIRLTNLWYIKWYKLRGDKGLFKYPPKTIKAFISSGDNKKGDMLEGVRKIKEITQFVDLDTVTEHVVDSLALGYLHLTNIRDMPELLLL